MAAPKYPAHEGLQLDDGDRSWQAPEPVSYLHDNEAFASEEEKFVTSGLPAYPSTAATPVICGLKKRTFWIIFTAVVLIIVIGAAVGGGVGGSLAAKKSKSTDFTNDSDAGLSSSASLSTSTSSSASVTSSTISTSTTSQSTTTSSATVSAVPLPTSGLLPLDCPAIDSKSYNTTSSGQTYTFSISCSLNFIGHDIEVVGAATIDACMDACANFIPSGGCKAIVFNSNLTLTEPFGGNCWFKNSTEDKQIVTELTDAAATLISITGG